MIRICQKSVDQSHVEATFQTYMLSQEVLQVNPFFTVLEGIKMQLSLSPQ